jgi:hypothetical protein
MKSLGGGKEVSLVLPTLVLAALVGNCSMTLAQTTPDSAASTFRVNTQLVLVDVIAEYIKDELHGRQVTLATELKQEDFRVFDNDNEMPIRTFDIGIEHTTRAIALWLIVQCPEGHAAGWASDFLRGKTGFIKPALMHLDAQDTLGVAHWCDSGEARIDLPPGHDPDAATAALDKLLSQPPVRGENRSGELAMQRLIRLLVDNAQHSKPDRLPILFFLYGDHCATYPKEAERIIEAVLEASGIVFGMSDGSFQVNPANQYNGYGQINYLVHHYSRETGGEYYITVDPKLFSAAVDYVITQLHLRYYRNRANVTAFANQIHNRPVPLPCLHIAHLQSDQLRPA